MSLIRRFIDRIRSKPPIIATTWGPVTESARHRAALNMRNDHELRARVEAIITLEMGGDEYAGRRECRRRYPEAYR